MNNSQTTYADVKYVAITKLNTVTKRDASACRGLNEQDYQPAYLERYE